MLTVHVARMRHFRGPKVSKEFENTINFDNFYRFLSKSKDASPIGGVVGICFY
jgi:hypothetical protein